MKIRFLPFGDIDTLKRFFFLVVISKSQLVVSTTTIISFFSESRLQPNKLEICTTYPYRLDLWIRIAIQTTARPTTPKEVRSLVN